ncbi:MAG: SPFH domain-containing protein [Deltaproteobacteria bacterium]|nr:SPFH domain-containing protein [Deltaproteobacteria bacterium]
MGFFDKLKAELVDIIEWMDDTNGATVVWRFPRWQNEIKNGARLTVRPGQTAVFVDQGRIADVFTEGMYELTTANIPILSTLKGWKHGFNSPFKSEVYFVSTKVIPAMKWGTPQPLMMRDADFGVIRVGAFGTYSIRCVDCKALMKELVGTDGIFDTDELAQVMRSLMQQAVAEVIGSSKVPALDLLGSYGKLADEIKEKVKVQIDDEYGLDLVSVQIVNINVPESVQKAMDQRASMGALGSASLGPAPNLGAFQQFQMGNSMGNMGPGGGAGMNMGMGLAMAGQMMNQANQQPAMVAPPPMPTAAQWYFGINGQNVGPLAMDVVKQFVTMGQIKPDTLAWTNGQAAWSPAATIPGLAGFFAPAGPPPLPGGGPPPFPPK